MLSIVAFIVVGIMVTFVLPSFTALYKSLGAELPVTTKVLLATVDRTGKYGPYIMGALLGVAGLLLAYTRTRDGRLKWDRLLLRLPLIGQASHLNELARCCRSIALLYRGGLPLSEIISLVIEGSSNSAMQKALLLVQKDMLRGEGLSRPMSRNKLFLPMMVQMVRVGEETGNIDTTLLSVAQSYETEAEDRVKSLIALVQPAITIFISIVVAFVALSLISAMYSMYGQIS
jgi:type IV pilus assembly protein PilC